MDPEVIERLRRSAAMGGLTPQQAIELCDALVHAQQREQALATELARLRPVVKELRVRLTRLLSFTGP